MPARTSPVSAGSEGIGACTSAGPTPTWIAHPGQPGQTQLFSAFVDDSTLFLETADQLPHALNIIRIFDDMSGLRVSCQKVN